MFTASIHHDNLENAAMHGAMHGAVHGAMHAGLHHSVEIHHDKHHDKHHGHHHLDGADMHMEINPFGLEVHHDKHHHNKHHNTLEHAVVHGAVHGAVHHSLEHSVAHTLEHALDVHHEVKHHGHHDKHISVVVPTVLPSLSISTHLPLPVPVIVPSIPIISSVLEFIDSSNKIYIKLNQPSYVGGDVVSGTVELDCIVPFVAKGVLLRVKGFERVWWEYPETEWEGEGQNRRAITHTREAKETKEFFKDTIRVYPQQGTVASGHYSFPFTYQLPPNLPGTYFEEGGHHGERYYAKVLYKLKATLDVAFRHDLHSTTRLVVNEKFDQLVQPSFGENSKSFLTSSGSLHIRTWLDKNAYFPGETVMAKLKANNTSVKPTRKIVIRVAHALEMRAHHHVRHVASIVYEKQFTGFEPCFYGVKWLPFTIPCGVIKPSSLMGNHIKSSYLFHLECDIPNATDLAVALPLRILAPQFLWSATPPQPVNAVLPPAFLVRPPWQPDAEASSCNSCKNNFTLFNRRHHCRHCAKIFCGKCVDKKLPIPKLKYKEPVRVCKGCEPTAQSGGKKYQSGKEIMAQWQASQGAVLPSSPVVM